jgi:hypothetical protein
MNTTLLPLQCEAGMKTRPSERLLPTQHCPGPEPLLQFLNKRLLDALECAEQLERNKDDVGRLASGHIHLAGTSDVQLLQLLLDGCAVDLENINRYNQA